MEARPKLIKRTQMGDVVHAEYSGRNDSGFEPIDEIVIVLPDQVSEMTAGGIELPADYVERMSLAAETGVIIAVAEGAFRWNASKSRPWVGYRPQPGDRVYMKRYAGIVMLGDDKKFYRMLSDIEIGAIQRAVDMPTSETVMRFNPGEFKELGAGFAVANIGTISMPVLKQEGEIIPEDAV